MKEGTSEHPLENVALKIPIQARPGQYIHLNRYADNLNKIPNTGNHITGHQDDDNIIVYQAYRRETAEFAQENQQLGGEFWSLGRMSWIKPNFLWMMYRCGWASKPGQERVLAISIPKTLFAEILRNGALSSFHEGCHESREAWKAQLASSEVRIQWDPEHDPYGQKQNWRAIQIGLKGSLLREFATRQLNYIQDITDFVKAQKQHVDRKELDKLLIPVETEYLVKGETLRKRINVSSK